MTKHITPWQERLHATSTQDEIDAAIAAEIAELREALQAKPDLIPQESLFVCGQMGANVTRVTVEQAKPVEPEQAKDSARYQWLKANVRCGNMGLPNNNWLDDNTADWDCWIDVCIADELNPEGNPV